MLNAGDIRTTYYLFGQYRLLAESLLGTRMARVLEIARYLRSTVTLAINGDSLSCLRQQALTL